VSKFTLYVLQRFSVAVCKLARRPTGGHLYWLTNKS